MLVGVNNETEWGLDATEFAALISFYLKQLYVSSATEMNLMMVDMATMTNPYTHWMGLPGPADVLSFPINELTPGQEGQPSAGRMLGDIMLYPDVAVEQVCDTGYSAVEEMLLLTVYGLLHLLGLDHITEEGEKTVFALQWRLLLSFLTQRQGVACQVSR